MNPNVPTGAAILLDFIGGIEAPKGYGTIYANKQDTLATPLTEMTVAEVQKAQPGWSKRNGSSAAGRYQFMHRTLAGLIADLGIPGSAKFTPELQDALAYELLKRRGYINFASGTLPLRKFGNNLAMEWASLPVLQDIKGAHRPVKRGETYYSDDGVNKVLTSPDKVEAVLTLAANAVIPQPRPAPPEPDPTDAIAPPPDRRGFNPWLIGAAVLVAVGLAVIAFFIPLPI